MTSAITIGYRRGIGTIIDANVVTLLTAFILFVLATSGIKGFAFTLGVGTLVSLLTAVVFTQALLGLDEQHELPALREGLQRDRRQTALALRLHGQGQVVLRDLGSDPADRRRSPDHQGSQLRHRLRVRHPDRGQPRRGRHDRGAADSGRPRTASADAEIQAVDNPALGDNAFQIESETLDPSELADVEETLNDEFGVVGRRLQQHQRRPDLRCLGRPQCRARDRSSRCS